MAAGDGGQNILAAGILGACVLASAFLLARSIDATRVEVGELTQAVAAIQAAVERSGPRAAAPPARPARRRRPDPDKVYDVAIDGAPTKGSERARVTLIEFSDFQCPFCARVTPTLAQIAAEYGDRVRIVFKHLPLSIHSKAPAAHAAAAAAQLQGKFWEMHDKIFANQREMSEQKYLEWAAELGMDVERFRRDVASKGVRERVERDLREASALGVSGTPAFFINGRYLSGAKPFSEFQALIERELVAR